MDLVWRLLDILVLLFFQGKLHSFTVMDCDIFDTQTVKSFVLEFKYFKAVSLPEFDVRYLFTVVCASPTPPRKFQTHTRLAILVLKFEDIHCFYFLLICQKKLIGKLLTWSESSAADNLAQAYLSEYFTG